MLEALTRQLGTGTPLSPDEAAVAVAALADESGDLEAKAAFLIALARKGETAGEIAAFATALRARCLVPAIDDATRAGDILDVVGTGGDRLRTINISTTAALIAAAAGVTVAKHGNRAVTSQSGSADVLEALGIRVELSPDEVGRWLREHGFAFLFAPRFHPAFRNIGPARRLCAERGERTIFNFLGPLLNPACPSVQLLGVALPALCRPMAEVLQSLGVRRALVVCGQVPPAAGSPGGATAWLDELSTLGPTTIAEFHHDRALSESEFDLQGSLVCPARLEDLEGGDRETNAGWVRRILKGEERGPKREAVLLNAGAALFVAGRARSIAEGWELAAETVDSGRATAKLQALVAASKG